MSIATDSAPAARPAAAPVPRDLLAGLSGLEVLRRLAAGELPPPPFSGTTRIFLREVEPGRVLFEGEPSVDFVSPIGTVHGGWAAALLDSAMACAVHSRLEAGQAYTTVEMKVNFVRPITEAVGLVRCEGRVLHLGGRTATSEGSIHDARGRLIAHGTETCLIFEAKA